jgi:Flp pilus assembly protein TadD
MMRNPTRRLILSALVLALLLPLSQCASKQPPFGVRSINPKEIARLDPNFPDSWNDMGKPPANSTKIPEDRLEALGNLSLENRDYENSLAYFARILKDHPDRYDLHCKVGVILLLSGQVDAARKELAMVLAHQPDMLEAHQAMGFLHLQGKNYSEAVSEFQTVLAKEPRQARSRYLLGITFLEAGQPGRAISELKQAAQLEPNQGSILVCLGRAYIEQKNYLQAITVLQKAKSLDPKNQKASYHLGMALAALKRYPEAMDAFLQAGDEAQAYNNIGVHYFLDGRYEEAAKCFQRALELRPVFYSEAKANLQRALEKLHQTRRDDS